MFHWAGPFIGPGKWACESYFSSSISYNAKQHFLVFSLLVLLSSLICKENSSSSCLTHVIESSSFKKARRREERGPEFESQWELKVFSCQKNCMENGEKKILSYFP